MNMNRMGRMTGMNETVILVFSFARRRATAPGAAAGPAN
jgi:hypothetical protein